MAKLVSKVYGDALFEAAMERDMLSPVYEEVQSLQTILMENADLVQFLNHPQIIKEEKLKVVENIFKGRASDDLMGFLETVIEKGRQKELPKILDYFVNRVKEYKKIGIVTVTSAVELSAEQKAHSSCPCGVHPTRHSSCPGLDRASPQTDHVPCTAGRWCAGCRHNFVGWKHTFAGSPCPRHKR